MEENKEIQATSDPPIILPTSFPSDVFKWMKQNAKTKVALKLMKVCKYFQCANYLVLKNVFEILGAWDLVTFDNKKITTQNLETISEKLWIIGKVNFCYGINSVASLLLNTVVCNIQILHLTSQNIKIGEFKALVDGGMVEEFEMTKSTITFENNVIVPLEDIYECLPNAQSIIIKGKAPSIHSLEAANVKISSKLKQLTLWLPAYDFDVQTFLNHEKIHYKLWFHGISKAEFDQTIAPSIHKIVQEWSPDYQKPEIDHQVNLYDCLVEALFMDENSVIVDEIHALINRL
uniref:Uncharacterized protein n=1 Tax=Panagrolaimus sp. PS1159 TaxID=55785 RepID=A0AC35FDI8_9BILA